jgi:rhamnulokinase
VSSAGTYSRKALVAVDLGAESCRVSLLRWPDGEPHITLVHRFANAPRHVGDSLRWSLATIEAGLDEGLRRCAEIASEGIASVAVDGWAVDYVRLDREGRPLDDPFCYRDLRTLAAEEALHGRMTAQQMRDVTAVAPMRINTLYQQRADRLENLPASGGWLNLPEYILFRLGGRAVSEHTNAAHSQMVDVERRCWSEEIFKAASLDLWGAPSLVEPGTDLGKMTGPFAELPAFRETRVIAPACHDTASAIAGIPALGEDWAYISSGTWSLVGTKVPRPVNTLEAAADGFTNLAAGGGGFLFHVNVNGMWMLSQCMEQWGGKWKVEELVAAAEKLPAPAGLLHVDATDLLLPGHMMQRMNAQLVAGGHEPLVEDASAAPAFANLIFHSLAARYREVLAKIEAHTGKQLRRVFVVGGGSRNEYLNRLLGEVTGLEIHRGSAESSTIGNFAVQLAVLEGHDGPGAAEVHRWAAVLQGAGLTAV